ncbi:MAG: Uma2 family endonuclease [Deltaproteobacteria bacterium]|nr:Uma2 family endonuclease [Nannocystaceae bacterium]
MTDPSRRLVVTEAMYLAMERAAVVKHELRDGEMWAMAGASPRHNRLASRCIAEFDSALRGKPCVPLGSDQRVHVPATGSYCYPDVSVLCGGGQYHDGDPDSITNPHVIVEVLSRTTQKDDRGAKFEEYRSIPSFEEYVLIWQDRVKVEVRRREAPKRWSIDEYGAGEVVELRSIGVTLDIDALYEGAFALRGDAPDPPRGSGAA